MSDARGRPAWVWAAALALALLVTVPSLFTRDLWSPDEPRYMAVTHQMLVTGDYVVPHINAEIYSEKPPMFFWLSALVWRLGGGLNSGRIVSLLAVAGTMLLLCGAFGRRLGARAAVLAIAASLSALLLLSIAKIGNLDPLLMFLVTCIVVLGHRAFHSSGVAAGWCWLGAYGAAGIALLTKGPVGPVIGGLILLAYGLRKRRRIRAGGWWHLSGVLVCLAIASAWLVPAAIAGGEDYARTILFRQTVGRAVQSFSFRRPFYYYAVIAPLVFLPWSLLLPSAAASALRQSGEDDDGTPLLAALWVVVPFVFLSLMSGKKPTYLLPCVPGVGLLVAWYLGTAAPPTGRRLSVETWLFRIMLGLLGAGCIGFGAFLLAGPALAERIYPGQGYGPAVEAYLSGPRVALGLAVLCVCLGIIAAAWVATRRSRLQAAFLTSAAVLSLSLAGDLFVAPTANILKSSRSFGEALARNAGEDDRIFLYLKTFDGTFSLYTGRTYMPVIGGHKDLMRALGDRDVLVVALRKSLVRTGSQEAVRPYIVLTEEVGGLTMVLLRGQRSAPPAPGEPPGP